MFASDLFSKNVERCSPKAFSGFLVPFMAFQMAWLARIALTERSSSTLSITLYPQFALQYLVAPYL